MTRDNSGNGEFYIDGVSAGSFSNNNAMNNHGCGVFIGANMDGYADGSGGMFRFTGYISNLRYVVGHETYTSGFTPSTQPFTPTSQGVPSGACKFLACQDETSIDTNSISVPMTADYGAPVASGKNPFGAVSPGGAAENSGSLLLDGNGDYIIVPDNADLELGNSDFTIEAFIKPTGSQGSGFNNLFTKGWELQGYYKSDGAFTLYSSTSGSSYDIISGQGLSAGSITLNTWQHLAICRSGSTWKIFVDGVQGYSASHSGTIGGNTSGFAIGDFSPNAGQYEFQGYISNFRVIKGTALYTSNFTAPTSPLSNVTNTKLLCCQSTTSATAAVVTPGTITTNGNPEATATNPFNSNLGSEYFRGSVSFDGSGDCLTVADNTDLEFGSGNFTLEAFINYTGNPGTGGSTYSIFSKWDNQNSNKGFILRISDDGGGDNLQFFHSSDGNSNNITTGSTVLSPGTWYHIAFVRNGSTGTFYINGVADSTTHSMGSNSIRNTTVPFRIGANLDGSAVSQEFNGLISNARVIKGTALYTSNFAVPTEILADVTNTKLLCCQSVISPTAYAVSPGSITNNGATLSTSSPFALPGSVEFTGDPTEKDYLNVAKSSDFDFSGVFTLEAWAYFDTLGYNSSSTPQYGGVDNAGRSQTKTMAESINWNAEVGQYHFGVSSNNKFQFYIFDYPSSYENRFYTGNTTITTGQWYHFMVNRDSSNNIRLYVDGTRQTVTKWINQSSQGSASYWNDSTALSNSNQPNPLRIGATKINGTIYGMDGKISNLRMTSEHLYGSGSTITVPTSKLTTTSQSATASNVKLLCCQDLNSATSATKSPTSITANNSPTASSSHPF